MANDPIRRLVFATLTLFVATFLLVAPTRASAQALEILTIEHDAPSVARLMKYNIVLPRDYETSGKNYPVLYLLHGLTSNYTAWGRLGVQYHARNYNLIVVMPDAGNSWYVNWAKNDPGHLNNWEDYIIKDLIPHVDRNFAPIANRAGRGINGLSMGGYGAITLGLRHPDLFCTIGSHSGALRFAQNIKHALERGEEVDISRRRTLSQLGAPTRRARPLGGVANP